MGGCRHAGIYQGTERTHTHTNPFNNRSPQAAAARPTAMDEQEREADEFGDDGDGGGGGDARARRRQTLVLGATGGGSLMAGAAELAGAFTEAQLNSASDRFREAWARVQVDLSFGGLGGLDGGYGIWSSY